MFSSIAAIVGFIASVVTIVQAIRSEDSTDRRVPMARPVYRPAPQSIESQIANFIDEHEFDTVVGICMVSTMVVYKYITALFEILTIFALLSIVLTLIASKARYLVLDGFHAFLIAGLHIVIFISIWIADRSLHPSLSNVEELVSSFVVLSGFVVALIVILRYMGNVIHAILHTNGYLSKRAYLNLLLCALFAFFLCGQYIIPFFEMMGDFLAAQSVNILS